MKDSKRKGEKRQEGKRWEKDTEMDTEKKVKTLYERQRKEKEEDRNLVFCYINPPPKRLPLPNQTCSCMQSIADESEDQTSSSNQ